MKKLFFIMAMSVCAFTAQAQTTSGIRVGLNMTSATGKYNDLMADQDYNNKSYMGYSIHYFIDVPVIGNFSIQPAVGLSMKGITYEYDKLRLGLLRHLLDSEHRPLPRTAAHRQGARRYGWLRDADGHLLVVRRAGLHLQPLPQD